MPPLADKLTEEVLSDFEKSDKNIRVLLDRYTEELNNISKEHNQIESMIPPDSEYWNIKSRLLLVKQLNSDGVLTALDAEEPTNKQSYRMLKYGVGHRFNRDSK